MSETLRTNDGGSIRLGRELGRGGEGVVYEVEGQPGQCAKIYTAKAVNARLHEKLRAMVADPPQDPTVATKNHHSIAWPTQLLYRGPADPLYFAGFVMPAIAGGDFKKAICRFHPGDRRKEFGGDFTWLYAYTAAMNIASAVAAIHERGYCIGDINESNILVAGSTMSTLIDCDSFQVRDAKTGRVFRCAVGKGEYTAPELGGKKYADVDRTAATDHFGLAVLMFQFLMEGCHPYQARGPLVEDAPTTEKKISLGHFPYRHAGKRQGVEPPAFAPPFDILHPELQGLFVRAFVDGHKAPGARPTSSEWYKSLGRLRDQIIECKANPNHRYFSQLGACPWCRLRQDKKGEDRFPEPGSRPAQAPAVRTLAPKSGQPVLKVSRSSFFYLGSSSGAKIRDSLIVENEGGGTLSGVIRSNRPWLNTSRNSLDARARSQRIEFVIDTKDLSPQRTYSAEIEIKTNGGSGSVMVMLSKSSRTAPPKARPWAFRAQTVYATMNRHIGWIFAAWVVVMSILYYGSCNGHN